MGQWWPSQGLGAFVTPGPASATPPGQAPDCLLPSPEVVTKGQGHSLRLQGGSIRPKVCLCPTEHVIK